MRPRLHITYHVKRSSEPKASICENSTRKTAEAKRRPSMTQAFLGVNHQDQIDPFLQLLHRKVQETVFPQ